MKHNSTTQGLLCKLKEQEGERKKLFFIGDEVKFPGVFKFLKCHPLILIVNIIVIN